MSLSTIFGITLWAPFDFGTTTPTTPPSFIAAVHANLALDPTFMGLLGGTVGDPDPGKIFNKVASPGIAPPWITLLIVSRTRERFAAGQYNTSGTLQVTAYADRGTQATAIADRTIPVLQTAADSGSIVWQGGPLLDLFEDDANSTQEPQTAPGVGRIWQEIRTFGYVYSGL